jgi:hypothetical protein
MAEPGDESGAGDAPGAPPDPGERLTSYRWKKGQSGNPTGRPATKRFQKRLRRLEPAAWAAFRRDLEGPAGPESSRAQALFFAYRHGKPTERIEHSGEGGEPLVIRVVTLTSEDLDAEPQP